MKNYQDLISVIIPVYKVEKYLSECVDSLLRQSYENLEIILVDDGSPDNCPKICDDYQSSDSRITVIHQKNQGLSAARNTGMRASHGKYICFVDSDDIVADNYCLRLYELLSNSACDFSVCKSIKFQTAADELSTNARCEIKYLTNHQYLQAQLNKETEFGVWNKMYRSEAIAQLRFREKVIHEDVIWSADLADKLSNGAVLTDETLYYYRQRADSIVARGKIRCSSDFITAGEYLMKIARKNYPDLFEQALDYTLNYPWSFVDRIFVRKDFEDNAKLLDSLTSFLLEYQDEYQNSTFFSDVQKQRMLLFSKSRWLYSINVTGRLIRTYIYRMFNKNPYSGEHGI